MGLFVSIGGEVMAKKKLTPTQIAYNKEVRRIKRFMREAEKRGYVFNKKAILPPIIRPNKKSVEKLKRMTPSEMYKKSVYGGEATYGEIVKGTEGRKAENRARSLKSAQTKRNKALTSSPGTGGAPSPTPPAPAFTVPFNPSDDSGMWDRNIINNFLDSVAHFPKVAYPIISKWISNLIDEYDIHTVAEMLEDGLENGLVFTYEIAYDEEKISDYMSDMENYLNVSIEDKAEMMDALEDDSNFTVY